jgi:predicted GTPase
MTAVVTLPAPAVPPRPLVLALVSHTNVGKTTLARTLLRRDVGEVRDQAHVTREAQRHDWLATAHGARLQLLDTPGWSDSARLAQRLGQRGVAAWWQHQVLDRWREPGLHHTQRELGGLRTQADVLLYLVNAAQAPEDTAYLNAEMALLAWLGRPVIVLLNQLGRPRPAQEEAADVARWQTAFSGCAPVKGVLALDAFSRCALHEAALLRALTGALPAERQADLQALCAAWQAREDQSKLRSHTELARLLTQLAQLRQTLPDTASNWWGKLAQGLGVNTAAAREAAERALHSLLADVSQQVQASTVRLLEIRGLQGQAGPALAQQVSQRLVTLDDPVHSARSGVLGGFMTGAAAGLGIDAMVGGMSLGAGALLGGLAGALGGAGLVRGRDSAQVSLSPEFLDELVLAGLLRELTVAHYGRGRGQYVDGATPAFWLPVLQAEVARIAPELQGLWPRLRDGAPQDDPAMAELSALLGRSQSRLMAALYPPSAWGAQPAAAAM